MRSGGNQKFSVDFKRNRISLIRLNSRNIRSELWRRYLEQSLIKAKVQSTIICLPIPIKTVFAEYKLDDVYIRRYLGELTVKEENRLMQLRRRFQTFSVGGKVCNVCFQLSLNSMFKTNNVTSRTINKNCPGFTVKPPERCF